MSFQKLQALDADAFRQRIVDGGETALVGFMSDWSAPCREMEDALLQAADHFTGPWPFIRLTLTTPHWSPQSVRWRLFLRSFYLRAAKNVTVWSACVSVKIWKR